MKNVYLLSLATFIFFSSQSQTDIYHPYPQDEGFWSFTFVDGSSGSESYRTELWAGDTLINGLNYLKRNPEASSYSGAIRQDIANEKLYYLDADNVEHDISINQSAEVDDTFMISPQALEVLFASPWQISSIEVTVQSVDAIQVGQSERRRLHLTDLSTGIGYSYVAGVGFTDILVLNMGQNLSCFFDNGQLLIGDEFNPACSYDSVEEVSLFELSVFPNPATTYLQMDLSNSFQNSAYDLMDITGKKLASGVLDLKTPQIDVSSLNNGIYLLRITHKNLPTSVPFVVKN